MKQFHEISDELKTVVLLLLEQMQNNSSNTTDDIVRIAINAISKDDIRLDQLCFIYFVLGTIASVSIREFDASEAQEALRALREYCIKFGTAASLKV